MAIQVQGLLQSIQRTKFYIAEAFGFAIKLVFHKTNIADLASCKKVLNIGLCYVEREVAKVGGVWGFRGKRKLVSRGESAVCDV